MTSITTTQLNAFLLFLVLPASGPYALTPGAYSITDSTRNGTIHLTITSCTSLTLHMNFHPSATRPVEFLTVLLPSIDDPSHGSHFDVHSGCKGTVVSCPEEVKGKEEPVVLVAGEGMEFVVYRYADVECGYRVVVSGIGNLPCVLQVEMATTEVKSSNAVEAS
jgi:hypothetical protein